MDTPCKRMARLLAPPPADLDKTRERLLRIKLQLERERGEDWYGRAFGAPPSRAKKQLSALQEKLRALNGSTLRVLRQALEDALWEDPSAFEESTQVLVRVGGSNSVLKGRVNGIGIVGALRGHHELPPLDRIFDRAIGLALGRLEKGPDGNPGAIGGPGRRAAQELIDFYCEVHQAPAPSYHIRRQIVLNPEPADFALRCLIEWNHPGAQEIDITDLVRSLEL